MEEMWWGCNSCRSVHDQEMRLKILLFHHWQGNKTPKNPNPLLWVCFITRWLCWKHVNVKSNCSGGPN